MGIRESVLAIFGRRGADSHDVALERVRNAMLRVTDEMGRGQNSLLEKQINEAKEIATLWHLRPDLMYLVAAVKGEKIAQKRVEEITSLFKKHHLGGASLRL